MSRFTSRVLVSLLALSALTSCATLLEGSSQEVTFEAAGATDVWCDLTTGELTYKVRLPQKITMKRSRLDMTADCYAPGNRHKTFNIPTSIEPWAATNVSNGVAPGVTYDAYSRALFKYPEHIIIDMSDTVATSYGLPNYHNADGIDPASAGIEDMGPKTNALPGDAAEAAKSAAAYEDYDAKQAFAKERKERMLEADPGVKK